MNQHQSRKIALQAIYLANQESDCEATEIESEVVEVLKLKELSAYAKILIQGVIQKREQLKADIAVHLKKGWSIERIGQITLAILELGLYEIQSSQEIGPKAAINEALNLCDEFADPQIKPFVNGVLGNFVE